LGLGKPMQLPLWLVIEAHAPGLRTREQLLELLGGVVDGERRDQRSELALLATHDTMAAPPGAELRHVVVGCVGEELVLAEISDERIGQPLRVVGAGVVLPALGPVSTGYIVEPQ